MILFGILMIVLAYRRDDATGTTKESKSHA